MKMFGRKSDEEIIDDLEAQLIVEQDKTEKAERREELERKIKELKDKRRKARSQGFNKVMKGLGKYGQEIGKNFK